MLFPSSHRDCPPGREPYATLRRSPAIEAILTPLLVCAVLGPPAAARQSVVAAQRVELRETNPGTGDEMGVSVDVRGDALVVGIQRDDVAGTDSGRAGVYRWTAGAWVESASLVGSTTSGNDRFGWSVAIDGDLALIGAHGENVGGVDNTGAAFVFCDGPGGWQQLGPLLDSSTPHGTNDFMGFELALDGNWLAVSVYRDDHSSLTDAGTVELFYRDSAGTPGDCSDDSIVRLASASPLVPSIPQGGAHFGLGIALEGEWLAVGAADHNGSGGADSGVVFVFRHSDPAGTPNDLSDDVWLEHQLLEAPPAFWEAGANFGRQVSLSGNLLAVSAHLENAGGLADSGAVYVYEWDAGLSAWLLAARLVPSDGAAFDDFGHGLALNDDGSLLAVGAFGADVVGNDSGKVYLFRRTASGWSEAAQVVPCDLRPGDWFGYDLAFDGDILLVGSRFHDHTVGDQGSAYVFEVTTGRFASYCPGDGSATGCPCGNDSPAGLGQGCVNSSGFGGVLAPTGSDSASADDLGFTACNLIPNNPGLLFAGLNPTGGGAGVPFGDGLRCAGGSVVRLGARVPNAAGDASWGPGLSALGGWSAGDTRRFQVWYRDPIGGPCGSGFNFTGAVEVVFSP